MDSNSPCKDLRFPRGPSVALKLLILVGTVLKTEKIMGIERSGKIGSVPMAKLCISSTG